MVLHWLRCGRVGRRRTYVQKPLRVERHKRSPRGLLFLWHKGRVTNLRAPVLEMLWEPHDPLGALGERFGFGDEEAAVHWVAAQLNEHWGVRIHSCERIVLSDHNALAWVGTSSGRLLAKWSVVPWLFERLAELA